MLFTQYWSLWMQLFKREYVIKAIRPAYIDQYHHCFSQWLNACSAPKPKLNCRKNNLKWVFVYFLLNQFYLKMYLRCRSFCWARTIYDIFIAPMVYEGPLARPSTHYIFHIWIDSNKLLLNVKTLRWGTSETRAPACPIVIYADVLASARQQAIGDYHSDFTATAGNTNSHKPFDTIYISRYSH